MKQQESLGKMPEIGGIFNFEVVMTFFENFQKNFGKIHKFSSLSPEFFMKSQSGIFNRSRRLDHDYVAEHLMRWSKCQN